MSGGSQSSQNLVAISIGYCQTLLTVKQVVYVYVGCNVKIGYSVQGLVAKVKDTVANG